MAEEEYDALEFVFLESVCWASDCIRSNSCNISYKIKNFRKSKIKNVFKPIVDMANLDGENVLKCTSYEKVPGDEPEDSEDDEGFEGGHNID